MLVAHLPSPLNLLPLEFMLPVFFLRFSDSLELPYLPQLKLILLIDRIIIIRDISLVLKLRISLLIFFFGVCLFVFFEEQFCGVFDTSSLALLFVEGLLVGRLAVLFGNKDWFA